MVVFDTEWRVHGAQEEFQVWRTLDFDQRPKLMHLQASLFLCLVIHLEIGKLGQVVADATAHRDGDLFAPWPGIFQRRLHVRLGIDVCPAVAVPTTVISSVSVHIVAHEQHDD